MNDSKSCSYELHNTIFALPRRAEHLETRNGESQSINSPCSKKLQRLDVQIGPRKQCQLQWYLLLHFILSSGISITQCFPCQHSPVSSLRPTQFKYLAFALGLVARNWTHVSHIFPSSPKQQQGNFYYISWGKFQYNQNTMHSDFLCISYST